MLVSTIGDVIEIVELSTKEITLSVSVVAVWTLVSTFWTTEDAIESRVLTVEDTKLPTLAVAVV